MRLNKTKANRPFNNWAQYQRLFMLCFRFAACGFGLRPKICRPTPAVVSSRMQEKNPLLPMVKWVQWAKWLELTSFVATIWVKDENNDRDIQFAHSSKKKNQTNKETNK